MRRRLPAYTPQLIKTRQPVLFWLVGAATATAFLLLIVVAPIAAATDYNNVANAIHGSFGILCHQIPERSFFIAGQQLAVCSRCTGLYAGFAFTVLVYPLLRSLRSTVTPPRSWLLLAAVPLMIDGGLTFFDLWQNTHTSRLLTGLLLGSAAVFYVMPGIVELSMRRWGTGRKVESRPTLTLASAETIATAPSDYSSPGRRI